MNREEKRKLFQDVCAPRSGDQVLFLVDTPHDDIADTTVWQDRREMAKEWYQLFQEMGKETGFTVNMMEYDATGIHNRLLPQTLLDSISKSTLVLALTEYSASSSIITVCNAQHSNTRGLSMPTVERRMEETAFRADYLKVKQYAQALETMLTKAIGAEIQFSTGDRLYMDLRNRRGYADDGECIQAGQTINFPSGEGCIAPYEAVDDEKSAFGESKTEGIWPADYGGELVKYVVKHNTITDVIGEGPKAKEMKTFFSELNTRANVAELGLGCNPQAVITGNVLEDEKVGLHIAYGMSTHLGGKIKSDMHQDICYSKGCPVEGTTVTLYNEDGSKTDIITDAMLRYNILY